MKNRVPQLLCLTVAAMAATPLAAQQRPQQSDSVPVLEERALDGPRLGFTYITGPAARQKLAENHLDPFMSLFGWHFEQIVRPKAGGPMFVIQQLLLVAGVDQGTAVPSASLLLGIRFPGGFEFGMGPNATPVGLALAMGIGKSLHYGGVTIPINIGLARSQGSLRTTFLVGYAIRRR